MKYRGEITVFLSLTLICVMSLLLGLLESARSAGSRLYLKMASDSAVSSVLSYYNRNLWDRYQLLFLEYESETAIQETFGRYLDFYLEQANMYPARREQVRLSGLVKMTDENGRWLEEEIAAYMKYRLPELVSSKAGFVLEAEKIQNARDFKTVYESGQKAGRMVRRLERAGKTLEDSVLRMKEAEKAIKDWADGEEREKVKRQAKSLIREAEKYPELETQLEKEITALETKIRQSREEKTENDTAKDTLNQEISACEEVIVSAEEKLEGFRSFEPQIEENGALARDILERLDSDDEDEEGIDWEEIQELSGQMEFPELEGHAEKDKEKAQALDRLEELFDQDFYELLLPAGSQISGQSVPLKNIPSTIHVPVENQKEDKEEIVTKAARRLAVSAYIPLYFASFTQKPEDPETKSVLNYEMEYLLGGKKSDRENLKEAINRVVAIRGALNLLYLLGSADKKAEADALAASVSAGIFPAQMALSFLILTMWAFGEAVMDVKTLLAGGKTAFFKTEETWNLSLAGLLNQSFLNESTESAKDGKSYTEYLECLLFLTDPAVRNYRMMDLIQWNIRREQNDFSVDSCAYQIELETKILQRHMFFQKEEYHGLVYAAGSY